MMGNFMSGERGKTGDHGQDGRAGAAGSPGATGVRGPVGKNAPYRLQLAAYAFFTIVTLLGFHQIESNQDDLMQQRRELCFVADQNREAIRKTYQDVSALAQQLITAAPSETDAAQIESILAFEERRLDEFPPLAPPCTPTTLDE